MRIFLLYGFAAIGVVTTVLVIVAGLALWIARPTRRDSGMTR